MSEVLYKISVVTAVYNVEEYLNEMIDSIVRQSIGFDNIQLILIDDGSKDCSGKICDKYAERYPENIVVIHQSNQGVSSARNAGLEYVKGEYINFCDADDKLEKKALEKMYNFLEKNKEYIDLVSIPIKFFGRIEGEHILNYKFEESRIINLSEEYQSIQLSLSSALVKRECMNNRRFDKQLSYAEDAQIILDIFLDKMRYGVINNSAYFYRKRETSGTAIDIGRSKKSYYLPCINYFILFSLKNALQRKKCIPQFIQYSCMYDLQWRVKIHPFVENGVLSDEERKKYRENVIEAISFIDDNIIWEQKNLNKNYKMAVMLLKPENQLKKQIKKVPGDLELDINGIFSNSMGSLGFVYEFIKWENQELILEGYTRIFSELENVNIILKIYRVDTGEAVEYQAEKRERREKNSYFMDELMGRAVGFLFHIPARVLAGEQRLELVVNYDGHEILCRNIYFGKFFPLSTQLKESYLYENGILLTYCQNNLVLRSAGKRAQRICEWKLIREMASKKDKMVIRGIIARKVYWILKRFKKKEIWIISDRLGKADDNGEAFFRYVQNNNRNAEIVAYFVLLRDSKDYSRMKKVGRTISYNSTKYKIFCLICDKVISSHGDDFVFNRFFNLSYLYKDILYRQKFIFLQHGITQNDLSGWLNRYNKDIAIFVTTTRDEYQSIVNGNYYYDERQVKCTGLPRYDYLEDKNNGHKIITFMPTWRMYLAGTIDVHTGKKRLPSDFTESHYCQMYQQIFLSKKLFDEADKKGYRMQVMLHPAMPEECLGYFGENKRLKFLDVNIRYRDIYAESDLVVTDYSSAVFDFAYLRKPVIYYQADKDEFFSGKHVCKKGYFDYERDGFGEVEYEAEALIDRIIEYMENGCQLKEMYRERIDRTFVYNDKNNCKRVYDEIKKLT